MLNFTEYRKSIKIYGYWVLCYEISITSCILNTIFREHLKPKIKLHKNDKIKKISDNAMLFSNSELKNKSETDK